MDVWLWLLYLLPVSGALKTLPEVNLDGVVGGSVIIECPLPGETQVRMYLCRQMPKSGICATVVSNNFVKEEYRHRVTLQPCSDRNVFLVEMTELTESDSGVYACGLGTYTERGKTQKVTLNVHSVDYEPFWEEEQMPESPKWLHKLLQQQMPEWFQRIANAWSPEFIPKVATPDQRTEAPLVPNSSTTTLTTHQPQTSRVSSAGAAKPPTLLLSTTASKISAQEGMYRPQEASYKHHAWLHRQRASNPGSQSGTEDEGFHILLIPSVLGLLLMALLGLLIRRAIQRRRAFSRRIRRLGLRMRALEASGRPGSRQPRAGQRPRSQNNVYSACPRRAPEAAAGPGEAPPPEPGPPAPSARQQVPETPWLHVPSLKPSCEYVTIFHQPAAKREDTDSDDYINIPSLTHLPSCLLGPRPWHQ